MKTVKLMKVLKALKNINARMILSFAVGLLTASIVFGIVYLSSSDHQPKAKKAASLTEEQMKEKLAAAGYLIHTEEEWDEMVAPPASTNENEEKQDLQADTEEPVEEEPAKEETVKKVSITVSAGMTSGDIGKLLVNEGFIDNAYAFSSEVEKKGVANKLQLGTYEIDSSMSMNEIIAVLFN